MDPQRSITTGDRADQAKVSIRDKLNRISIRTMDDLRYYYKFFDLRSDASLNDVKQAYRDLVAVWHPDRFSHNPRLQEKAQDKLKKINAAYELISKSINGSSPKSNTSKSTSSEPPRAKTRCANTSRKERASEEYSKLEDFLIASAWKEADLETKNIILKICNRAGSGWLQGDDIDTFPSVALNEINKLWFDYSDGDFGFSVQKEIWDNIILKCGYSKQLIIPERTKVENQFGDSLGWRTRSSWLSLYDSFDYDKLEIRGKLPRAYIFTLVGYWSFSKAWTGYLLWEFDRLLNRL